jgi:hypothetical protein
MVAVIAPRRYYLIQAVLKLINVTDNFMILVTAMRTIAVTIPALGAKIPTTIITFIDRVFQPKDISVLIVTIGIGTFIKTVGHNCYLLRFFGKLETEFRGSYH